MRLLFAFIGVVLLNLILLGSAIVWSQQPDPVYLPVILSSGSSAPSIFDKNMSNPDYHPFLIFDANPPPIEIPAMQQLASGASSDQEVIDLILAYYNQHSDELQAKWLEDNPARLKAIFAMYIIHISHPYGNGGYPATFVEYLQQAASHCGPQSVFQTRLLSAFGLTWRRVGMLSGLHGWVEVKIDGQWETFDSTTNVWIDQSFVELLQGGPRKYREFYTPWSDIDRPDARQILAGYEGHSGPFYYTPGSLRAHMPGLGIYFFRQEYRNATGDDIVISGWSEQEWQAQFTQASLNARESD